MIRLLAVACAALLVAACAAPRGTADIAIYDLGAPQAPLPGAASAHAGIALEVRVPAWLDNQAMTYRLAYAEPQRLRQYARARWAGLPASLLQLRLRQLLAVAPGGAPCTLRVELDDFSQVFDTTSSSRAELRGEALLLGRGRVLLARLPLRSERQVAGGDAASGAAGLAAATEEAAATLASWLQQQDLASCRIRP